MNELIIRFAIAVVCIIGIAAVVVVVLLIADDDVDYVEPSYAEFYEEYTETAMSETSGAVSETTMPEFTEETMVTTVPEEKKEEVITRKIITSRTHHEYDNNAVYIDMENIQQLPELPVGCEITALTILLRHLGFDVDKCDMARDYLPLGGNARYVDGELYKDSFFDYFIGDPFSNGYGCFANAIEKAAVDYIEDHGGGYTVYDISGSTPDELYDYIASEIPVICWATDGMIEPEYYESWYDNATGEKLDWYLNEHCFVLAGFNMEANIVTLNDPMKGIIDYNKDKFELRYEQMHSQAVVIVKDDVSYTETIDE